MYSVYHPAGGGPCYQGSPRRVGLCQRHRAWLTGRGLLAWQFGPLAQTARNRAVLSRITRPSATLPRRTGEGHNGGRQAMDRGLGVTTMCPWLDGHRNGKLCVYWAVCGPCLVSQRDVAGKRPSPRWSRRTKTDHRHCSPERSGPEPSARRDARRTTILLPVIPPTPRGALLAVCSSFPPPGFPDCDLRSPVPAWRRTGPDAERGSEGIAICAHVLGPHPPASARRSYE